MAEENKEEIKETEVVLDENSTDKGKEFVDNLKAKADERPWDGRKLFKVLKGLLLVAVIVICFLELYGFIWPKVQHNFPENIPLEEKCKSAKCSKSCNGKCSCTYVNKYNKEEKVTCVIEG